MDTVLQDLRYAVRMLLRAPGFTAVAVITLALGIGANTAVFSVLYAVLLRPLPYAQPQQLVKIWGRLSKEDIPQNWISEPEWWDMRQGLRSFSGLAAYSPGGGANLSVTGGQPVRIARGLATASLFPLLGVNAAYGRTYSAEEDQPGRNRVVVLSYAFWAARFGSDPHAIGQTIQLNAESYAIVGVLPKEFAFAGENDLWTPLGLDRAKPEERGSHYLHVIGRLRPGVTPTQAGSELNAFAAQLGRAYPTFYPAHAGWGMFLVPLYTEQVGHVRLALLVVFAAVAAVLLMACVNLANLLLARASIRAKEIAVRAALGAGRGRLIRQFLTESVLIACVGGSVGVLLSIWGADLLRRLAPESLPRTNNIAVDGHVLLFAAVVSVLTGILFGLAPAIRFSQQGVFDSLKAAGRSSPGAPGRRLRGALVVAEISLAVVLLVVAGLMVRSLQQLLQVSPGFQPEHLLTARVALPEATYKQGPPLAAFYRELLGKVRALPGVRAAGAVTLLPMSNTHSSGSTYVENTRVGGLPISDWAHVPYIEADRRYTVADYFAAMRIPLLDGRLFNDRDSADAPKVAIVDQDFVRRFWPTEDPIGKRLCTGSIPGSNPPQPQWRTVVGVVGHVENDSLDQRGREQVYIPQSQVDWVRSMSLAVRTTMNPTSATDAVRAQVAALDPTLPLYQVKTMDEWLDQSLAQRRFNMGLLVAFAVLALILAAIGTYGVISCSVSQRIQEIGIRMALGAAPWQVVKMVLGNGLRLVGIGIGIGIVAASVATRLIASLFFGVRAFDPATFAGVAAVLAGMALLAAYLPARRATRVNPIVAMHYE